MPMQGRSRITAVLVVLAAAQLAALPACAKDDAALAYYQGKQIPLFHHGQPGRRL